MNEPILSREEVEALAHRICARYFHSENIHLRQYTFGITTLEQLVDAVLERVCGEPIYQTCWQYPASVWGDVEKDVYDNYQTYRYACRRIVYALNRSKA